MEKEILKQTDVAILMSNKQTSRAKEALSGIKPLKYIDIIYI